MFALAHDVLYFLHQAGMPYKHVEIEGTYADGLASMPSFKVGLGELSEYEDVARSLRLRTPDGAEAVVRAWFDARLAGSNARFVGRLRPW